MVKFTSKFVSKIACLQHEPRYALLSSKNEKKGFRPSFFGLQWQGISFKKDKNNGLILSDKYIPMELIEILFCYLDHKSLQICQLVCRKWKNLIREYIYSKKVEIISGQSLHCLGSLKIPWEQYYKIYKKNPFEQNLMMNQKEAQLLRIMDYSSNNNSGPYDRKARKCVINLFKEGLPTFFMDYFQPTIEVQQSYKFRWNSLTVYNCTVTLIGNYEIIAVYKFIDKLEDDHNKQNKWFHFTHNFKNYGPGVKNIIIEHSCDFYSFGKNFRESMVKEPSVIIKAKRKPASGFAVFPEN